VYAAIWFALALAGVAGVLLVLGAQFLGVATIVVYAGAILVMFLFVLMLAQPAGLAPYDRVSSEPLLSALAGATPRADGTMVAYEPPQKTRPTKVAACARAAPDRRSFRGCVRSSRNARADRRGACRCARHVRAAATSCGFRPTLA
jgi:hypothetical protein